MRINKLFMLLIVFLFFINIVNSVEIQQINPNLNDNENKGTGLAITFISILVFIIILFFVFLVFVAILVKIIRHLTEFFYKRKGYIYEKFIDDKNQCLINYDNTLKRRLKRYFWLFYRRQPVYIKKNDNTTEVIGYYEGEAQKKENYYLIAVYNKIGFFKSMTRIILIPNEIKNQIINKFYYDKKASIVLYCDGIDNIYSTDFYFIPLIKKNKTDINYLNFSDNIFKNYIELNAYQDIIGESLNKYKKNVIKAVESNPKLQENRLKGE